MQAGSSKTAHALFTCCLFTTLILRHCTLNTGLLLLRLELAFGGLPAFQDCHAVIPANRYLHPLVSIPV